MTNGNKEKEKIHKAYLRKREKPGQVEKDRKRSRKRYMKDRDESRRYHRELFRKKSNDIRERIFDKLGHSCVKCGFSDKRALCIDHVNGGGHKDRNSCSSVFDYYNRVLEDKTGKYQILCQNCNWIKRYENNEDDRNRD